MSHIVTISNSKRRNDKLLIARTVMFIREMMELPCSVMDKALEYERTGLQCCICSIVIQSVHTPEPIAFFHHLSLCPSQSSSTK